MFCWQASTSFSQFVLSLNSHRSGTRDPPGERQRRKGRTNQIITGAATASGRGKLSENKRALMESVINLSAGRYDKTNGRVPGEKRLPPQPPSAEEFLFLAPPRSHSILALVQLRLRSEERTQAASVCMQTNQAYLFYHTR